MIPPCDLTIDDRRALVRPHAATDTVGDLVEALDLDSGRGLWIDRAHVTADRPLQGCGLRAGAAVATRPSEASRPEGGAAVGDVGDVGVEVAVIAGPCCQHWRGLAAGRHLVGRSPSCDLVIEDPAVELHQGALDVTTSGTITFAQLTGRVPARLDGDVYAAGSPIDAGRSLHLGASRIVFRSVGGTVPGETCHDDGPGGSIVASESDPWRRVVRRGPARPMAPPQPAIAVPAPPAEHRPPPFTGLVGAAIAAAGAGLMAVVLGQPLFAAFALLGAVATLATWVVAAAAAHRRGRRALALHRQEVAALSVALDADRSDADRMHRADHFGVADALGIDDRRIWERRVGASEPLRATLGRGTWRRTAPVDADDRTRLPPDLLVALDRSEQLEDVPVPLTLAPGEVIALHGDLDSATALARSIVVQLATWYGPADWRLHIETKRPVEWEWTSWLPHTIPDALPDTGSTGGAIVVVTDDPGALAARTGPLRRFLDSTGAAAIVITPFEQSIPSVCSNVLELGTTGVAQWRDQSVLGHGGVHIAGVGRTTAEHAARRLASLIDPEDHDVARSGLAHSVALRQLFPDGAFTAEAIACRWAAAGPDPAPVATIGWSGDGTVDIDLVRDGPHGLIAGTTGSGKSELLRTFVVAMAAMVSPDHVNFVLVDFKGGATFDTCDRLPHVVGVVTDLEQGLAERVLVSLDAEVHRRERLLRLAHADDLVAYRRNAVDPLARLVVVIDEFATLAKELPDFLPALVGIAQRGRSLGIHLLLATQRPAGVVTDDIRANTNLRLALRLQDRSDAVDVIGDDRPAAFPRDVPGRAGLRLGPDELVVFQTASTAGPSERGPCRLVIEWSEPDAEKPTSGGPSELTALVDAIGEAAFGLADPHRPWIDPLPVVLTRTDCSDPHALGLVDDPAAQARRSLRWEHTGGNLLLVGELGSGTTTTAVTIAATCLRRDDLAQLYVVDGRGEPALDAFSGLAACGGVVRVGENERLDRLMRRLTETIDERALTGGRTPSVLVVIDGLGSVRNAAPSIDRVLAEGPAVGVVCCATTDGTSAVALATNAERWVLHVDPAISRAAGLRTAPPPDIPGRLGLVESGLTAQVVHDPDPLAGLAVRVGGVGVPPIGILPEFVDAVQLAAVWRCDQGHEAGRELLVGLGADTLEPATLRVPDGDHIFIGGAARTGKSTALRQIAAAWRTFHPDGVVVERPIGRPNGRPVQRGEDPGTAPILVVVDDADRVEDHDGELAAIVAGRRPGVTIAVAARLEAVRVAYGHWVRAVTRSRCGLIMTAAGEVDGELLGVTLPRRSVIDSRPGLAWVIDARGHRLVQVAARMPA